MSNIEERSISISTRTIVKVIITILALMFLWAVRDVIALVFTSLILAALITPFAQWAKRRGIPKGIAVIFCYVVVFGGLALTFALVLPQILEQLSKLGSTLGRSWQVLSSGVDWVRQFSDQYGLSENLQAGVSSVQDQVAAVVGQLFSTLTDLFGGLVGFAVVLVMTFYMVVQEEEAMQWFKNFLPEEHQQFATRLLTRVQAKFGSWLIGQLALCLIVGVVYYIGLRILGVEGALVLALLGGFTEFIPYLGPILGGIPAVIVAASQSPMLALLTAILYVAVQQVENHVLVPKVMQKAVGINPVVSIVALLVGEQLFGIVGAILAIPVATACSVIAMEIWRFQKAKE
jgi:predicted PurR-regulated permease PerM